MNVVYATYDHLRSPHSRYQLTRSVFIHSLIWFLCVIPGISFGQVLQDTSDRVHIDHSDIINGEILDGHEYLSLIGNVELSQDSTYFYCDSAMVIDQREVRAFGNITIQKGDSLQVYADTLLYFADTRLADLYGEVALIHGGQQLWTSHLTYDMNLNVARYDAPAELIDGTTQLASKQGVYWVNTEEALFIDSVVVIGTEFNMVTDSLRYHAPTQIARFIAPTWIFQDGAEVYCEDGFYDFGKQNAEFRQNAEYVKGDQRAWADVIAYDGATREVTLTGNAHYIENARQANGDTIVYNERTGDTRIAGNAEFRDETRYMRSDKSISYNRITENLSSEGRGVMTEGSQILAADNIDFSNETGKGIVTGNVVLTDTAAQIVLEGDYGEFVKETGYFKIFGETRPLLKTLIDTDTMYMTSDTLISFEARDSTSGDTIRYMQGYRDVRIFRGTMQGLCDSLAFNGQDSVFRMFGMPVLWSDTTQFTGDTIDLHLKEKKLEQVVLRGSGLIISELQKTFYNQIKGKRIVAQIQDNEIRNMQVDGNAESVYYAQDEEGAFLGVNEVASSEIYFTFLDSKIDRIVFNTRPSGVMTPMSQIDHSGLRLDGFVWRTLERPQTLLDLF